MRKSIIFSAVFIVSLATSHQVFGSDELQAFASKENRVPRIAQVSTAYIKQKIRDDFPQVYGYIDVDAYLRLAVLSVAKNHSYNYVIESNKPPITSIEKWRAEGRINAVMAIVTTIRNPGVG